MNWSLSDPSDPTTTVLSTAAAKAHLRLTGTNDDTLIAALISAATVFAQHYTGRLLYSQLITEYADGFPNSRAMPLHVYPVLDVTLSYRDSNDDLVVMDQDDYWRHVNNKPVVLEAKSAWPSTKSRLGAVEVEIIGGDSTPPTDIVHALKLIVGFWYESPEEMGMNIPNAARVLLAQHRLFR